MNRAIISIILILILTSLVACNQNDTTDSINIPQSETTQTQSADIKENTDTKNNTDSLEVAQEAKSKIPTTTWKQKNTLYDYNFVLNGHYLKFIGLDLYVFGPRAAINDRGYFKPALVDEWGTYYISLKTIRPDQFEDLMGTKDVKVEKLEEILTNDDISIHMKTGLYHAGFSKKENIAYEIENGEYVTIEGIDMYKFDGRVKYTYPTTGSVTDSLLYGYAFMYDGALCQVTATICNYENPKGVDKETAEKNVKEVTDDIIHTINNDPWTYDDNYSAQ